MVKFLSLLIFYSANIIRGPLCIRHYAKCCGYNSEEIGLNFCPLGDEKKGKIIKSYFKFHKVLWWKRRGWNKGREGCPAEQRGPPRTPRGARKRANGAPVTGSNPSRFDTLSWRDPGETEDLTAGRDRRWQAKVAVWTTRDFHITAFIKQSYQFCFYF